jgi:1,4-alpha-glucan branching enzyme
MVKKKSQAGGPLNSKVSVEFKLSAPHANDVRIAGDFTQWEASARPLQRGADGIWWTQLNLKPGRHEYKFLVDGQWQIDPACSNSAQSALGSVNSVIEI